MATRGRPRKPTELKLLHGTHREDRDGPLGSAVRLEGVPAMPGHLNDDAKAFWSAVVPGLVATRVAAACDAPVLGEMCVWWEVYRRFSDHLQDTGAEEDGALRAMVNAKMAWKEFDRIAARFGLTPSDRARLRVDPAPASAGVQPRKRG
jgi:P27 family predicted phage terminase small subunit